MIARAILAALLVLVLGSACVSAAFLRPKSTRVGFEARLASSHDAQSAELIQLVNASGQAIGGLLYAEPDDQGTLMVSGGNGMGRLETAQYTRSLRGHGYRVLAFSFQGYDDNGGKARLDALLGDSLAVHAAIRSRFPGEPVAYLASSISTVPALCLPSRAPDLAGVILEGTMNVRTIGFAWIGWIWQLWPLAPLTLPTAALVGASVPRELRAVSCARHAGNVPALFLHHPDDAMTPYRSARRLFDAYAGPKQFRELTAGNPRFHLLLANDSEGQASVVQAVQGWFAE